MSIQDSPGARHRHETVTNVRQKCVERRKPLLRPMAVETCPVPGTVT